MTTFLNITEDRLYPEDDGNPNSGGGTTIIGVGADCGTGGEFSGIVCGTGGGNDLEAIEDLREFASPVREATRSSSNNRSIIALVFSSFGCFHISSRYRSRKSDKLGRVAWLLNSSEFP
jgi:hypothetical protein